MTAGAPGAVLAFASACAAAAVLLWPRRGHGLRGGAAGGRAGRVTKALDEEAGARRAATVADASELVLLLAMTLRSGCGLLEALEAVADVTTNPAAPDLAVVAAAQRWGESAPEAWARIGPVWRPVALAYCAAADAGVAPVALLEEAAQQLHLAEEARVENAVQRASVHLVLPLGLCFLPGFVCTAVLPVVLHLVGSVTGFVP